MVLVKRVRNRGANMVVEAHGEVLFAATGDVGRWTRRFSQRVLAATAAAAPANKRPRWSHYGKPLKSTFRASTTYQPGRMRVYSAVGSTAAYSAYVDQGTGVYAGNGPYPAKILPPWQRGSATLYEHTWRPPGSSRPVRQVMIRGQRGQFFFAAGLKRGFASMRMRSFQVPGDAQITEALSTFPDFLENFIGNTPSDAGFRLSLTEWRAWRDKAFNSGRLLGREGGYRQSGGSRYSEKARQSASDRAARSAALAAARAKRSAERSKRWREKNKAQMTKPDRVNNSAARRLERSRFIAAAIKKYGAANVDMGSLEFEGGYWYITVKTYTRRAGDNEVRPEFKEIRGRKVD